ncbi:hypothetical protein FH609_021420 [Streptomyces sp. 3MP-14]|uniref:DUF3068 domain-containing protein n=1 Tax=Streptomyces mimosae TaxID=2586635 RepID=A0A5N6A5X8_9ACTN|nr:MULTISPECIES: hypothetical protein [Streptomyces]KAB8163359.1 hypothetical protein FH607_018835 [Streptomyces mimosae]KAB8174636.1 hypothetical protein FH609_021420 [Streptomyces sp. 3MP-14]
MRVSAGVAAIGCSLLVLGPLGSGAAAALPGASPEQPGPRAYAFATDAESVQGAASSADAPTLAAGGTYTDEIGPGETLHYAVDLDAGSSAYLTTVAAPEPGAPVASTDGIDVELLTTDNETCSSDSRDFGGGLEVSARPISASADRTVAQGAECQRAGAYVYTVTRSEGGDGAGWPIELRFDQEPQLTRLPEAAPPLESWETEQPSPATGEAVRVAGGTGFNDAQPIGEGVWRDDIAAGATLAYRVPVDWGQQLALTLDLGNAAGVDEYAMTSAQLTVELYNPVAARVGDAATERYDGEQLSLSAFTPGVAYGNRFEDGGERLRFAGWHYLLVTMGPELSQLTQDPVGMTLRVSLEGQAEAGPAYASDPVAAGFGVSEEMVEQAERGLTDAELAAEQASEDKRQRGYLSLGAGVALGLGIGVWYLVGRRRALAAAGPPA